MLNTLFIGKVYRHFDEITSTNDYALALLAEERNGIGIPAKNRPPEGMLLSAAKQSAGRGQFGSRWESPAGENLLFSVILYPEWLPVSEQFYLSMAIALGVWDTFHPLAEAVTLKWPNDLYVGAKKMGGILIQNALSGHTLQSSVVGIGLNINQLNFYPDLPNPTSLALETGKTHLLDLLLEQCCCNLENRYLQLKAGQKPALKEAYIRALFRLDQPALYCLTRTGEHFEATLKGITETGRLCLATRQGLADFDLKEISWVL